MPPVRRPARGRFRRDERLRLVPVLPPIYLVETTSTATDSAMDDQQTREELNRRYWESDASVSEIADELDISRRALYDGIEPLSAGVPCPVCGGTLGFRNRTAAENQEAECPECGREMPLEEARGAAGAQPDRGRRRTPRTPDAAVAAGRNDARTGASPDPELEQERSAAAMSPIRRVPDAGSGMAIGSLVLVGMGVGALAVYLVRQRG